MKHITHVLPALFLAAAVAGCGSSRTVQQSVDSNLPAGSTSPPVEVGTVKSNVQGVPAGFLAALEEHIESILQGRNLLSDGGRGAYTADVTLTNYRMRSDFNRFMFGVFAGKDGVDSQVTSCNASAMGSIDGIARVHAGEIVDFIAGGE